MTEAEQRFIDAWRVAGPALEKIRNQELRQLDDQRGAQLISKPTAKDAQFSGLAIFQSWMMRQRVFDLMHAVAKESRSKN